MNTAASSARRACIVTVGCRLNQAESAGLARQLETLGYVLVPEGREADLGVINTCAVTARAEADCRRLIRAFLRTSPNAFCVVLGCYSQVQAGEIAKIPGVDLVVGNAAKSGWLGRIRAAKNPVPEVLCGVIARQSFTVDPADQHRFETRANLKVQDGCDAMCTFCIVPLTRGRSRSRLADNVVEEARALSARGVREVVLTGVNVGTYRDGETTLVSLIDLVGAVAGIERVRLSSIEPAGIDEALLARMADPGHALVPYLHVPLQSGSDSVLKAMRRGYTGAEFLKTVERAADRVPDLCLGTDVLAGFPGESERDFADTFGLLEKSPVAYAHVFSYSPRPGTPAFRMGGRVPEPEKRRRSLALRNLMRGRKHAFYETFAGRTMPVLFETRTRGGLWSGLTENYLRVQAASSDDLRDCIRPVRLEKRAGESIRGELAE